MTQNPLNFRRLLDPLPVEVFFDEHLDQNPAFVGGEEVKIDGLISWDEVTESLNNSKLWSSAGLTLSRNGAPVPAAEYCFNGINRDLQPISRPDPVAVLEHLANGATLGLENIENATAGLMRLSQALASALGGSARARVAGSGPTQPSEVPQFDIGDAFHLQLDGTAYLALFEERATPGGNSQPEELAGELEMTAGDVLYLPAGQFYQTAGVSEGCLTLTVTVMRPSGVELLTLIYERLTDEALFRTQLPYYDDNAIHGEHLEKLAASIETILGGEDFVGDVETLQRRLMALSKNATFSLPSHNIASFYRVGLRAEVPSGLEPVASELAVWAQDAEIFTLADLLENFAERPADDTVTALKALEACGFVEPATRELGQ
ncbi:MAG TPA: hypothetical protein DCS82_02325 [Rhodospirillaceae bacterium]|nr:hypothetical protein [Rhodospirillaceae bacterium]HAA93430.1 hypothetical protein [Rhodospirillaceae bacterium]HAT34525.1 hypothetical protein [Rhodospirillaceae bacterium]